MLSFYHARLYGHSDYDTSRSEKYVPRIDNDSGREKRFADNIFQPLFTSWSKT